MEETKVELQRKGNIKLNSSNSIEDTDAKTISLTLYRYMCQNIVGTENHVRALRLMNTIRDNTKSDKIKVTFTSGSFGEGLEMRGSDLDIMSVDKHVKVNEDVKTACNSNVVYLTMETDDVKPGYTQLLIDHEKLVEHDKHMNCQCSCKYFEQLNGKDYFSSALFKKSFTLRIPHTVIHGPCISDTEGMIDFALCLHSTSWVLQASQWITRSNYSWPSYKVKQSILKHGVLFVPIGVKDSPKENIEWRISFSVGEQLLIYTFTHTQLICYALLKILLKDVIATYAGCEDLLCSYFLKTIIFWISEELPQSIWKPENLIHCFIQCFRRLIYSVDYSICLHYFIPENNMFDNKIEGRAREILLEKLNTLHSYGWRCILFSDQLSKFRVSMWMYQIEPHTLHTIEVSKPVESKLISLSNGGFAFKWAPNKYKRGIQLIVSCHQSSVKYFCLYYISFWCGHGVQSMPLQSAKSSNKHQYKQFKSCLCTLLQNTHHDAVSGWLMLASYFYKTKQYNNALYILVYSLSKCTPEKIYRFNDHVDMSDIHHQLFKLKLFRNKSIVQLWKIMLIDHMFFFFELLAYTK